MVSLESKIGEYSARRGLLGRFALYGVGLILAGLGCSGSVNSNPECEPKRTFYADTDEDGFGGDETVEACENPDPNNYVSQGGDCDDSNKAVNPDVAEICDGVDNNCKDGVDEGGNSLCDNETFCDGEEMCEGEAGCVDGNAVDCSMNDLPAVSECNYNPDGNSSTLDVALGFTSMCDEVNEECSVGEYTFSHFCNVSECGAECEDNSDCADTICDDLDGCVDTAYHKYGNVANDCETDCSCEVNECGEPVITENDPRCVPCNNDDDCDALDKDYCDGSSVMHDEGKCEVSGCGVESTLIVNCDDGDYCDGVESCVDASCVDGNAVDCSMNDLPAVSECNYNPDGNSSTLDVALGFTSMCDESNDTCTTSTYDFNHACDVAVCGAECDDTNDCAPTGCENLDGCVGNDFHDYTDVLNNCLSDCSCTTEVCGEPVITENDPRCVPCNNDDDCDSLDENYCEGDLSRHKEGRCIDFSCQVEITTVTDCSTMDNNRCESNEVLTDTYTCFDSTCILDNTVSVENCDDRDTDLCNGTEINHEDYSCSTGSCVLDSTALVQDCNNGQYCDGEESCVDASCVDGTAVDCDNGQYCDGLESCNETTDSCDPGIPVDYADGVNCTVDSCDEVNDIVVNTPDDGLCDNGQYCDGLETCDVLLDCQNGMVVDCDNGQYCDGIEICDEGLDSCVDGTAVDCDNGQYCDGLESCNETTDSCDPGIPVDYADGVNCTVDSCDEVNDIVVNTPDDGLCDNGQYCDGLETCDVLLDCQNGTTADCSGNDISGVASCDNDPDGNPATWDSRLASTSTCQEEVAGYSCTTGDDTISHTCDVAVCGAECESDGDCADTDCDTLDGCVSGTYRDYSDMTNSCLSDCSCTANVCVDYVEVVTDGDSDGRDVECENDCNDGNGSVWQLLIGYVDNDEDGFTIGGAVQVCSGDNLPTGYLSSPSAQTDCDDNDDKVYPGASEDLNGGGCDVGDLDGKDNGCDGTIDEICMVDVITTPPVTFRMGCDNVVFTCEGDDAVHDVELTIAYKIDKFEVTNEQYLACENAGGCSAPSNNSSFTNPTYHDNPAFGDFPVLYVNWDQANTYCQFAGKSLPPEAQWEYAARSDDEREFPPGNITPDCTYFNYNMCVGDVEAVNSHPTGASPFGALNMSGNGMEWVSDWYEPFTGTPKTDPEGPPTGDEKVVRGGAFPNSDSYITTFRRTDYVPNTSNSAITFRCGKEE